MRISVYKFDKFDKTILFKQNLKRKHSLCVKLNIVLKLCLFFGPVKENSAADFHGRTLLKRPLLRYAAENSTLESHQHLSSIFT